MGMLVKNFKKTQPKPIVTLKKDKEGILTTKSACVDMQCFNATEIQRLINELFATMNPSKGSGIAAPQIGVNRRVIVFGKELKNFPSIKIPLTALINPEYEALMIQRLKCGSIA